MISWNGNWLICAMIFRPKIVKLWITRPSAALQAAGLNRIVSGTYRVFSTLVKNVPQGPNWSALNQKPPCDPKRYNLLWSNDVTCPMQGPTDLLVTKKCPVTNVGPQLTSLWSKNITCPTQSPDWPALTQNVTLPSRGPTDLLVIQKRHITNVGSQLTSL